MVSITLEEITKYFGKVLAVDGLNLEIKDKEFVVLLGPSGCGKTTTLRIIAGLETPTRGKVYFDNEDVTRYPPQQRNVSMVFQNYALYPHMSVFENIAFPLIIRKLPKEEIKRRVKEVAELLRIEELLDRKPGQLSGGQQQRVALGRALVKEPDVFLLDEPLSNLDAKLRVVMRGELKKLQKKIGITTVYVTHDQVEAMTMADRVAVLNEGKLQQYSSPEDLYIKPQNIFVAGFIGSPPMNFLPCKLSQEDGQYYLESEFFKIQLKKELGEIAAKEGKSEFILGIRPRYLNLNRKEVENSIKGEVYVTEPLGDEQIITVKLNEEYFVKVLMSTTVRYEVGETVWLTFDQNKIHLFDKDTEKAII